ncbi:hypothetical protein DWX15_20435 [Bacteroides sp. AF18-33]|uniref:hypothetical protein n=1 Tax=Bacteroides sp. AF18-33 TaxID=2292920 RepID=UPI000E72D3F1|nr:hypothetical protein [Bacteroides sp. AF18-33]RJV46862.1 hypothetical protein DWX15_20435 [Bacteroides sp. AF18-33]
MVLGGSLHWIFQLPLPQSERGDFTDKPQAPTLQDERHDRYLCNTILIKARWGGTWQTAWYSSVK